MKHLLSIVLLSISLLASGADAKTYGSGPKSAQSRSTPTSFTSKTPKDTSNFNIGTKPDSSTKSTHKKYGSGDSDSSSSVVNAGSKPQSSGWAGSTQQKEQHSEQLFAQKNPTPKPAYVDARGQSRTIRQDDPQVQYVRSRLNNSNYSTRNVRITNYYGNRYSYYRTQPVVIYSDHFSSPFHYWLLDQPYLVRGDYVYNHRYDMDPVRYALYMNDPLVANRVSYLESINYSRNTHWTPAGWDYDAMLDDNYVTSVYNPSPVSQNTVYVATEQPVYVSGHSVLWTFFGIVGVIVVVAIAIAILRGNE